MANPFKKDCKVREGTVCDVPVCARAVPFAMIRRMLDGERQGDDTEKLLCMADTVAECVTLANGEAINVDELDAETIGKLFAFAAGARADADFTQAASPAGGDQAPS